MKSVIVLLLTACIPALGYYHEGSMRVLSSDTLGLKKQSLFGYSTTYQDQYRRLLVSAPRSDQIGKIFEVDVNSGNINEIRINILEYGSYNYTYDYLLGVTVSCTNSYCITCAPGTIDYDYTYTIDAFYMTSECFIETSLNEWYLLPKLDHDILTFFNGHITTFGWSISSNSTIMMGSPGSEKGGVVLWNSNNYENSLSADFIINSHHYPNFGYSVISGKFLSEKLSYVVSTTYGDYGQGKILFYRSKPYLSYSLEHEMTDGDVGSKYGATMAAVNLGGIRTSLLVGAPTYNEGLGYDKGAVYLYLQKHKNKMLSLKRIVTGTATGGYFGSAITSVGDMDADGLDEVAIGAPYEDDGVGAVYVYSGAGLISNRKWFQRLQPAGFRTFGFSITTMNNLYDNGCQGIAIGAPDSNKVVIFKGIPAITVTLFTTFPNLQTRENKTVFEFLSGMNIQYPKNLKSCEANISVTIELMHPSAQLSDSNSEGKVVYHITLGQKPDVIQTPIKVLTPTGGYYNQKISYRISASLVEVPVLQKELRPSQVMLSESSVLVLLGSVSAADCEGICIPNLKATFTASLPRPYISGSTDNETISLSVTNEGETAYTSCVILRVNPVLILKTSPDCVRATDEEVLICKPRASLGRGETWQTGDITLETSSLTSADVNIKVQYNIYEQCEKQSNGTHHEEILLNVRPVSHGISIQGTSNAEEIVNVTARDVEVGKRLEHIYKISNTGPTNWVDVDCTVQLPKKEYKNLIEIYVTVKTETTTYNCSIDKDYTEAVCRIAELRKNNLVSVYIRIFVLPTKLGSIIEKEDIKLNSKITLALSREEKSFSITNTLHYNCNFVAAWIIVLAVLFGLLLIAILIIVLYRCGFLKRKNKEAAEKIKRNIKSYKRISSQPCEESQDPIDDQSSSVPDK